MKIIKVLGPGCPKCEKLFDNVKKAVSELELECDVEKITDINAITNYHVMITPALVIDEKVKSSGKALSVDEVKNLLR